MERETNVKQRQFNVGSSRSQLLAPSSSSSSSFLSPARMSDQHSKHQITSANSSSRRNGDLHFPVGPESVSNLFSLNTNRSVVSFVDRFSRTAGNTIDGDETLARELQDIEDAGEDSSGVKFSAFLRDGRDPMNLNERNFFQDEMGSPSAFLAGGEHIRSYDAVPDHAGSRFIRNRLVGTEDTIVSSPTIPGQMGMAYSVGKTNRPYIEYIEMVRALMSRHMRDPATNTTEFRLFKRILGMFDLNTVVGEYFEEELRDNGVFPPTENCLTYLKRLYEE